MKEIKIHKISMSTFIISSDITNVHSTIKVTDKRISENQVYLMYTKQLYLKNTLVKSFINSRFYNFNRLV